MMLNQKHLVCSIDLEYDHVSVYILNNKIKVLSIMSQQIIQKKPWVLISVFKYDTNPDDLFRITPQIQQIIDDWQSSGKIMWSGAFSDNATGMAVFEGTEQEANEFYAKYDKICSGILKYTMYQWDAMPILSVLSNEK